MDVITLGESMLRLSPPRQGRIEQTAHFNFYVAGAESNVAMGLARLGKKTAWVSRLPDNPMAHLVTHTLQQQGVDISGVKWVQGERLGLYFMEVGASPRPSKVWYDRAHSAASHMTPADLPREQIQAAKWLHLTGITPALSESCHQTVKAAIKIAQAAQVKISFDVNYRALLWSPEQAATVLEPLCQQADVVFIAARDAKLLFGAPADAAEIAVALHEHWGSTLICSDGSNGVYGSDDGAVVFSPAFKVEQIVDRIGAGDALAAGVICRLLEAAPLEEALTFGCAMAALKLTIPGDVALVSRAEVELLVNHQQSSLHR